MGQKERNARSRGVILGLPLCLLLFYAYYNIRYYTEATFNFRESNAIKMMKQVWTKLNAKTTDEGKPRYNITFHNKPSWIKNEYIYSTLNSTTCPQIKHKCFVYTKNKYYDTSKSIIFFGQDLPVQVPIKKEGQIWSFFSIEPPFRYSVPQQWKDKFNWTMTYRRDSDITVFYGKVGKREIPLQRNYSEIFRRKKKTIAWAVSHCKTPSKREDYIKKLQKYINVDIYGKCGKLKCGRPSGLITKCHMRFAEEYKFYLAIENSICKDYTSEKLFNFFFHNLTMIPIVNGPQNVLEYIPKGTFINILDYSSPSELAKDLRRIGSNETLYTQYLQERDKYRGIRFNWVKALCLMCVKLHEKKQDPPIPDIHSWIWNNTCIRPH